MKHLKTHIIFIVTISMILISTLFQQACAQSLADSSWSITATDTTNYNGVTLGTGRIGLVSTFKPFHVKDIILNNVYGKGSALGVSKILKGLNFANLDIYVDGTKIDMKDISDWKQVLNMKEASLTTSFKYKNKLEVVYTLYALRGLPYSGLMKVNIKALHKISVRAAGEILCPSDYKNVVNKYSVLKDLENRMPLLQTMADSPFGKQKLASTASFIFNGERPHLHHDLVSKYDNELFFSKQLAKGQKFSFGWGGAICTSQDFYDPLSESARMVIFLMQGNLNAAITKHKKLWQELWRGDIVVQGDIQAQRDIRLALFNLYSFGRAGTRLSIAPMGLSSQGYNGHIFWDAELWMYPPLLLLNQGIANSMLNYRFDRLKKAEQKTTDFGYRGAMFPWESDNTGEEACPVWALTGTFEQHITADVGIAFWNYYRISHDKKWLRQEGYPMLKQVADFWVSRAVRNQDGSYSINNVVGADEFLQNINDNAFTNASAQCALEYATRAAKILNITPDPVWMKVADKLKFYHFPDGVTKENSTYHGQIIKQADVNLLAYPLGKIQDRAQIIKDLKYYEPKISKNGPAMGYSVLSILYARLGNKEKAYDLFKRAYIPNKRPPFGALSESANSNNPYFATGAGGMLQAVLFGFGGLEITNNGIIQGKTCLPEQWKSLTIKGVGPGKKTYYITR